MGFGLHYGWAIEGAIGSKMKVDASYLSPHVNMVSVALPGVVVGGLAQCSCQQHF